MKYLLYLLLAITLYLIFSYIHFRQVLSKSSNPEIIQSDREFGSGQMIKYIAAGDSTSVGVGASRVDNTYPYKLAEFLATDKKVLYKNIGVSGAKIEDVIVKQLPQIIAFQPDIITISIGGNDIDRLASKEYVVNGFKTITKELTEKTSAKIYLANLPNFTGAELLPKPYVWLIEKRSGPMNEIIANLENDRVKIANVHDIFGNSVDVPRTYSSDYFHPSDFGYEYWVKAFLEKMK